MTRMCPPSRKAQSVSIRFPTADATPFSYVVIYLGACPLACRRPRPHVAHVANVTCVSLLVVLSGPPACRCASCGVGGWVVAEPNRPCDAATRRLGVAHCILTKRVRVHFHRFAAGHQAPCSNCALAANGTCLCVFGTAVALVYSRTPRMAPTMSMTICRHHPGGPGQPAQQLLGGGPLPSGGGYFDLETLVWRALKQVGGCSWRVLLPRVCFNGHNKNSIQDCYRNGSRRALCLQTALTCLPLESLLPLMATWGGCERWRTT